jgi:two-component system, NarL family, nitrate/nitrite response regulator NarL
MTESIKLVLIDQPTLFRRCVVTYLQRRRGLQVVADSGSGALGVALARSRSPDVVVVEPNVPEGGRELIVELCRAIPNGAVVVLTDSDRDVSGTSLSQALQAGARAYLDKGCEPEDLVRAVQRAAGGEVVVSANPKAVASDLNTPGVLSGTGGALTNRQREVVRLVAGGFTNAEIARTLSITEHTAKGHLAQILRKLALGNRVQLATYALQQGLGSRDHGAMPDGLTAQPS